MGNALRIEDLTKFQIYNLFSLNDKREVIKKLGIKPVGKVQVADNIVSDFGVREDNLEDVSKQDLIELFRSKIKKDENKNDVAELPNEEANDNANSKAVKTNDEGDKNVSGGQRVEQRGSEGTSDTSKNDTTNRDIQTVPERHTNGGGKGNDKQS